MKIVGTFLLIFFQYVCYSGELPSCAEKKIEFYGQYSWKKRDKISKKVITHSKLKTLPDRWDANSNAFNSIFISEKAGIDKVSITIDGIKKSYPLKRESQGLKLEEFNFYKEVAGKKKPLKMNLEVMKAGSIVCQKTILAEKAD